MYIKTRCGTLCGLVEEKILSGSEKREPPHEHSDEHTTTPMLTCAELWNWNTTSYPAAYLLSHLSMGQRRRETRRVGKGEGGRLTSCIWALKSAHEDNWKDCTITWATACGGEHMAHSPWSGTDTQQADTHQRTHSSRLSWKTSSFPLHGVMMGLKHTARFYVNVRSRATL